MLDKNVDFDSIIDSFIYNTDNTIMKTDVKEHENHYELFIDLPGYNKDNIKIYVDNGYLVVCAKYLKDNGHSLEDGTFIHRERYLGQCQRKFYVGEGVKDEDIKATYKNGTLCIKVVKVNKSMSAERRYIDII